MKKRFLSLSVCMVLLLTITSCSAADVPTASGEIETNSAKVVSESQPVSTFSDVPADAWYAEAVTYCKANGIMGGTSATTFAPEATLTRAMLATVLHRMSDTPAVSVPLVFIDAAAGSWYSDAVAWAAKTGVIEGYGGGIFGVNDPTTREQAVTILWRYAGNPESAGESDVSDAASISDWAQAAVRWAEANGILDGMLENNRFDPKANIKRGEVASMFYHYLSSASGRPEPAAGGKTLVAYFSATNTTRPLAEYAADILSADLYEIVPEVPYTEADLKYYTDCRADREQKDFSARPAISGGVENMEQYNVIFLGYPIWHGQAPRIISTFLESYDLTRKTIVPFCTSHSSEIGSSDTNLHALASGANWLAGRRFAGGTNRSTMEDWINSLDLPEKEEAALPYDGVYPQHEPYGTGIGTMPGRVVWAYDPDCVDWDGEGYWWELDNFDETVIQRMVDDSIASLGGKNNARDGWIALFQTKNGGTGYRAGEKIAIKANINGSAVMDDDTSGETAMSYTNPVLLKALLTSLVEEAGVAPSDITVYDVSRLFPDYMVELCTGGKLRAYSSWAGTTGWRTKTRPFSGPTSSAAR